MKTFKTFIEESIADGLAKVTNNTEAGQKRFPKGTKVRLNDRVHTVAGHNGNMVHLSNGEQAHVSKIQKVNEAMDEQKTKPFVKGQQVGVAGYSNSEYVGPSAKFAGKHIVKLPSGKLLAVHPQHLSHLYPSSEGEDHKEDMKARIARGEFRKK